MLQFEPQATQQEELEPENPMQVTDSTNKSLSSEETALVESMTRFYNSLSAEYEEDNQDESSG